MATEPDPGLTAAYDYDLPRHLIAARPAERRDASRLLVVERSGGRLFDRRFATLPDLIEAGDGLVLNDSRVFPARLRGAKPTGASAEILLLRPVPERRDGGPAAADPVEAFAAEDPRVWEAMVRPGGKLKPGRRVVVGSALEIEIIDSREDGTRTVRLHGEGTAWDLIERHGRVPLPPYIERPDDEADRERYQTVYARRTGSVAAPTAGLHFTPPLLEAIRRRGARIVTLTLHVGIGTFRPVGAARVEEHELEEEAFRLGAEAASALNESRRGGGKIWAVGTTVCRALETACDESGRFSATGGWTGLFIRPPYRFRGVDALVTNFHLPRSSLLMLVSAFAGRELTRRAYEHAVRGEYRFYSYGDAMAIL